MREDAPRLVDLRPLRGRTAPGAPALLRLAVAGGRGTEEVEVSVTAHDLARRVARVRRSVTVPAGGTTLEVQLDLPDAAPCGYHVHAELEAAGGAVSGVSSAVLVVRAWHEAPRMGFLSDFGVGETRPERIGQMAAFHLTVVQFYDWMYRHYRFLPPQDAFEDGMGRALSLRTVRERIAAVHDHGMAALAYGAVYGAEREYADAHPEQVLRRPDGEPYALIDRFFITDPRPGAWRDRLLDEYEETVTALDFDAIHMDQYGSPKRAYDANGRLVELAEAFPGLVDAAAERVARARAGASVTFNAVNDWPVEAVAASGQAIVYVEVWRPHDRYRHLVDLVRRARELSGGKQVVLAAYLEPFRSGGPGAEASALLATAIIAAAGGHHLLLGEGHGVLRDPYYPNHGRLGEAGASRLRRLYDHTAALHTYLFDADAVERSRTFATGENPEVALAGAPVASEPTPGAVWLAVRELPGGALVIHLVNLTHVDDDAWNAPQPDPLPLRELELDLGGLFRRPSVVWADAGDGRPPVALDPAPGSPPARFPLPPLTLWATVVVREGGDAGPRRASPPVPRTGATPAGQPATTRFFPPRFAR